MRWRPMISWQFWYSFHSNYIRPQNMNNNFQKSSNLVGDKTFRSNGNNNKEMRHDCYLRTPSQCQNWCRLCWCLIWGFISFITSLGLHLPVGNLLHGYKEEMLEENGRWKQKQLVDKKFSRLINSWRLDHEEMQINWNGVWHKLQWELVIDDNESDEHNNVRWDV